MKRILTSAVAILLITATVHAQTDTTQRPRHERRSGQKEGPYARLNLTADQQAEMKSLREEFKQKHETLRGEKLTEAERKSQLEALRAQHKTAVEALLTPEQKAQWETMKNHRNGKRHEGKRSARRDSITTFNQGGLRGDALQKELNLTAEQQAKLKTIRADFKTKGDALRNDPSLTQTEKREKLRSLMQQQQEALKTVLTAEQREKWQSLRQERLSRNTR